jgi:hypothetical protein
MVCYYQSYVSVKLNAMLLVPVPHNRNFHCGQGMLSSDVGIFRIVKSLFTRGSILVEEDSWLWQKDVCATEMQDFTLYANVSCYVAGLSFKIFKIQLMACCYIPSQNGERMDPNLCIRHFLHALLEEFYRTLSQTKVHTISFLRFEDDHINVTRKVTARIDRYNDEASFT